MAERRRRKCPSNENDNGSASDDSRDEPVIHVSNPGSDGGNSEYESVDEEELGEEEDNLDEEEPELIIGPDGIQDPKNLDHDEDRKNPQYIPKRGTFYEHDDRTMGEGEEPADDVSEKSAPLDKETKKKVWKEDGKWQHDRFSMFDQSPKSREELVATYGYDIRNEEGPPKARRRRRYGRGPNKYTRNWEDLDAYSKPSRGGGVGGRVAIRGGKGKTRRKSGETEDCVVTLSPKGPATEGRGKEVENDSPHHPDMYPVEVDHIEEPKISNNSTNFPSLHDVIRPPKVGVSSGGRNYIEDKKKDGLSLGGRGRGSNRRGGRPASRGHLGHSNYEEGNQYSNRGRGDGQRGRGDMKKGGVGRGHSVPQGSAQQQHKDLQDITNELKSITITPSHKEEHNYKGKRGIDNRRNVIPPRLQESMRGNKSPSNSGDANSIPKPKRYSSQRQRPLPDQMGQYHSSQGYYDQNSVEPGYPNKIYEQGSTSPGAVPPPSQLSLSGQAPPTFVPPSFTNTPTTFPPGPRLFPPVTRPHLIGPPVAGPPIAGPPPPVTGPAVAGPVPGGVRGPPVTGPPFLPPENMINYAAGAPTLVAAPHPPQFPPFQAFPPPVSQQQPQEIYSNGVMYYNTQSQQHLPRMNPVLQKRPKAAIPIVPPPDKQSSGSHTDILNESQQEQYEYGRDELYSCVDSSVEIESSSYDNCLNTSLESRSSNVYESAKEETVSGSEETYELAPSESVHQERTEPSASIPENVDVSTTEDDTSTERLEKPTETESLPKEELPSQPNEEEAEEREKTDEVSEALQDSQSSSNPSAVDSNSVNGENLLEPTPSTEEKPIVEPPSSPPPAEVDALSPAETISKVEVIEPKDMELTEKDLSDSKEIKEHTVVTT